MILKKRMILLIPVVIVLLVVAGYFGVRFYRQLTTSVQVQMAPGPASVAAPPSAPLPESEAAQVAERLRAAGLNETLILDDTAISGHVQRLQAGEVSKAALLQYADDLDYLNRFTAEQGGPIPTDFWDVRSQEMQANGWDEYNVVRQISVPEAEPYLLLLAQSYGRFLRFKAAEALGEDTAVDAALDMFAYVAEYQSTDGAPSDPSDDPVAKKGRADAMLMVWQSLVAGSTRTNPLTGKPMFSHIIFARDNVGVMHQYDVDRPMGIAEAWGVTGFAPQFVGIPENNNQVEHMTISMMLQMVMGESVLVLNGIEEEKVLRGQADQAEAQADMALNGAVHSEFAPLFVDNWQQAVERLRCVLTGAC
jgi:hypothetical protein